jgi:hypothetical protein
MKIAMRWKTYGAAAGMILLAAALFWAFGAYRSVQAQRDKASADLKTWRDKADAAAVEAQRIADEFSTYKVTTDDLLARKPQDIPKARERIRIIEKRVEVPGSVEAWLVQNRREITWANPDGSVNVRVPDACLGDSVEVKLDTAKICRPYSELGKPPEPKIKLPAFVQKGDILRASGRYGYSGIEVEATMAPIAFGSDRHMIGPIVGARGRLDKLGQTTGEVFVGVEYRWKMP